MFERKSSDEEERTISLYQQVLIPADEEMEDEEMFPQPDLSDYTERESPFVDHEFFSQLEESIPATIEKKSSIDDWDEIHQFEKPA